MFDEKIIGLVLWAPFALIVLVFGIIFCVNGYRKGLWRALLSLCATVVSALISVLIAPLIAKPVSVSLSGMIEDMNIIGSERVSPSLVKMVNELVRGVAQSVISLVLFGGIFFILAIILKVISAKVKKGALVPEQKGLRFAGLGVRLLDTVLYALIMLMPVYGTLSAYIPVASAVMNSNFIEIEDAEDFAEPMEAVGGHLLVKAEGIVPFSSAYNGLTTFNYGDGNNKVCLSEMMDTFETVLNHYNEADRSLATLLESDLDAEIGALLNDQGLMIVLKEYLFGDGLTELLAAGTDGEQLGEVIKRTLFSGFSYEPIKDKKLQAREGRAILLMIFSADEKTAVLGNLIEGLATHPMIGAERVEAFIKESGMLPDVATSIVDKLVDKLEECTTEGYDGPRFAEYYSAIEGLLTMISTSDITELIKNGEANLYFLDVHPDALKFATELFNDFLGSMGGEEGGAVTGSTVIGDVLVALPEELEKLKETEGFVPEKEYESVATMMEIAQIATSEPEKLDELIESYSSENRIEINGEVIEDPLAWYAESELIPSLLENVMDKNGTDPLGIGESLTQEQKDIFAGHLDNYLKEMFPEGNKDLQEDLDTLKAFLGM